jgi:hypothetical protein
MIKFKPGDGATYSIGSDSYPYTIRAVSASGKTVWATQDQFRAKPGANHPYQEGNRIGTFIPVDGELRKFTFRRKSDLFRPVGSRCGSLFFGRSFKQDPHF